MSIEQYTEFLVKSILIEEDMVKVKCYEKEADFFIIEVMIPESSMGAFMGRDGRNIKAIRTLVNVYAYLHNKEHVEINVESF